jgi:hypothetical protein
VRAGRETRGHRFHHPAPLHIAEPDAYAPLLETEGRVLADFATRRAAIRAQVLEIATELGGQAVIDEELLDEVTALVEWPVALAGSFDRDFLEVPQEALVSAMQDHQKYFPVVDGDGRLLPHFITVANIESRDPAQVRAGNERVIRPRLADARFFWDQDRKQKLEARCPKLAEMVFQQRLGTLADKQRRVAEIAAVIAGRIGADPAAARRAAQLAKCDLLTQMVYEFPELQGIMGRYYALHDGEPAEVAAAIEEQYRPRFAGDAEGDPLQGGLRRFGLALHTVEAVDGLGRHRHGLAQAPAPVARFRGRFREVGDRRAGAAAVHRRRRRLQELAPGGVRPLVPGAAGHQQDARGLDPRQVVEPEQGSGLFAQVAVAQGAPDRAAAGLVEGLGRRSEPVVFADGHDDAAGALTLGFAAGQIEFHGVPPRMRGPLGPGTCIL